MSKKTNKLTVPSYSDEAEIASYIHKKGYSKTLDDLERHFWLTTGAYLERQKSSERLVKEKVGVQCGFFGTSSQIESERIHIENERGETPEQVRDRYLSRAGTIGACISAKSQRAKNRRFEGGKYWHVRAYENLVTISPKYDRETPITAGRNEGEVIHRFTKRSRQRMMIKAKKMRREGLPLPYFLTLTYRHNMKDFKRAKKHLNAFFQRFRRINSDFRYFWKMEPQKRGAIHFHIAFFPPSGIFPGSYKDSDERLEFMRMRIGAAWNEITGQSEGFECERSKNGEYFGNMALLAGTNVRAVDNWTMFVGYVGKYMKKEVGYNPWESDQVFLKRWEIKRIDGSTGVPVLLNDSVRNRGSLDPETGEIREREVSEIRYQRVKRKSRALNTGRWWGFSRNFDFEAIQEGSCDVNELNTLNEVSNTLNSLAFASATNKLIDAAGRAKKNLSGKRLKNTLNSLRNRYINQKQRYLINKEKIKLGYFMQYEIHINDSLKALKYAKLEKHKFCPLLLHYYK